LKRFKGAVEDGPRDALARYGLALAHERLEQTAEAQAAFNQAAQLKPGDPDILRDLGASYFRAGKLTEAMTTLKKALEISPEDPAALYYLGRAYQESGQLEAAQVNLKGLVSRGLGNAEVYQQLGLICGKRGDLGAAHYYQGLSLKMRGDFVNALFHLRQALPFYKGKPEEESIRQAIQDSDKDPENNDKPKSG
jgi:Flp pilus assembly protein TadD